MRDWTTTIHFVLGALLLPILPLIARAADANAFRARPHSPSDLGAQVRLTHFHGKLNREFLGLPPPASPLSREGPLLRVNAIDAPTGKRQLNIANALRTVSLRLSSRISGGQDQLTR